MGRRATDRFKQKSDSKLYVRKTLWQQELKRGWRWDTPERPDKGYRSSEPKTWSQRESLLEKQDLVCPFRCTCTPPSQVYFLMEKSSTIYTRVECSIAVAGPQVRGGFVTVFGCIGTYSKCFFFPLIIPGHCRKYGNYRKDERGREKDNL